MAKKPQALYLDNIETSASFHSAPNVNNIKASEPSEEKKLSIALKSLDYYKTLTDNISKTLLLCTTIDDIVFGDRASKLLGCGTKILIDNSGTIISANFCRQRVCPMCQRRRSLKVCAEFHRIMQYLGCSWLHLVLTVPNCSASELPNLLDTMQVCASRLFGMEFIKKAFKGIARCTEVTYNKNSDTYHPHFHCLVAVNKSYFTSRYYVKIEELRRVWTVLVQADQNGIKVKNRNDKWIMEQIQGFDPDSEILYQCCISKADEGSIPEVAKYAVKPLDIDLEGFELYEPLHNIFYALHGRRLIQTYGTVAAAARSLRVDFDTMDDCEADELPTLDKTNVRYYNWDRLQGKYIADGHPFKTP